MYLATRIGQHNVVMMGTNGRHAGRQMTNLHASESGLRISYNPDRATMKWKLA